MAERLNIRDLEQLSGIKAHTIRIWEKRYNLFEPQRSETNIRSYSNEDLKKLLNVVSILDTGKRISQVCSMSENLLHSELEKIQSSSAAGNLQILVNDLIYATLSCDGKRFNTIFKRNQDQYGLERTIEELIYPLLRKIGLLWTVSKLNPAQEHFASQQIRQKLFAAIENLPIANNNDQKWMLFLPDKEDHEIALLYANYLIQKSGFEALYLGPNLPVQHAISCAKQAEVSHLLCFFTIANKSNAVQIYLEELGASLQQQKIYFSGLPKEISEKLPDNFHQLSELEELKQLL